MSAEFRSTQRNRNAFRSTPYVCLSLALQSTLLPFRLRKAIDAADGISAFCHKPSFLRLDAATGSETLLKGKPLRMLQTDPSSASDYDANRRPSFPNNTSKK
ncbi:hypothetical protein AVEN_190613-1 [Araneus ventricosus]|uniref:Uncharacterized protein n=1 Tax=Araneus ventricosus TaxID=182803 RepID=A0A4Y2CEM0_ARAVE|nr:hypothetical protein AVEN_190613-1 [Araneus ventricosus]